MHWGPFSGGAGQEEWNKVVSAAYRRHMMAPVDEGLSPGTHKGISSPMAQRFISNFIPINEFLEALPG